MSSHLEFHERLTVSQQFRLIEIAHETKDSEVKAAALYLLYPPLVTLMPSPIEEHKP